MQVEAPDALCTFSYSEDGESYSSIGKLFYATRVLWSSTKMGFFCTGEPDFRKGGYADFDWFRVEE